MSEPITKDQSLKMRLLLCTTFALVPSIALATSLTSLDIGDMLTNAQSLINPLLRLLLAISFITGLWFLFKALIKLKSFAQPLTQTSHPGDFSGPMMYILVGAVLIYIPTSTNVMSTTFFGSVPSLFGGGGAPDVQQMGTASAELLGYASVSLESQWATLLDTVVYYINFIGFLAFIRGWILIANTQHGQHEQMTKGIVHVVGGILAINFLPLVNAVINTVQGNG